MKTSTHLHLLLTIQLIFTYSEQFNSSLFILNNLTELHLIQMNEEIEKIERTVAENKTSKDVSGDEDALDAFMVSVSQALVTSG